jgi:4-hydroxy-3-methylbut-2-enyl diphosphate reductase
MQVIVAEKCGFCHGVKNAIMIAEKILDQEKKVYCLGPIIHNKDVVERLARSGLKTVKSLDEIPSGTVLIRSHGAAPDTIEKIRKRGLKIVDATCVLVKRVQQIAKELDNEGYRIVVIGDQKNREVRVVVGWGRDVIVIVELRVRLTS